MSTIDSFTLSKSIDSNESFCAVEHITGLMSQNRTGCVKTPKREIVPRNLAIYAHESRVIWIRELKKMIGGHSPHDRKILHRVFTQSVV